MKRGILIFILVFLNSLNGMAQLQEGTVSHLSKRMTMNLRQKTVKQVLQEMSTAGHFYFSYNARLINQDSVVNIQVQNESVREVLERLFKGTVDCKENGSYVFLRYAIHQLQIEPDQIVTGDQLYAISGYVTDLKTGKKLKQASVFERKLLQSTLTDEQGYFSLRFKGDYKEVVLTASKETYKDTSLVFLADIHIQPQTYHPAENEPQGGWFEGLQSLGISRFLLSSRQKIQDLNVGHFLANTPFQVSFLPGVSSQGIMSSRIVNTVSLNVLGGYTAGVDGVELGGLFNLNLKDMRSFQAAGLMNVVGGKVEGVQLGGVHNLVRGTLRGVQAAGVFNWVREASDGVQLAGVLNLVDRDQKGVQAAGILNYNGKRADGGQIAGLSNINHGELNGFQISPLFNYTQHNKGLQIGLINYAGINDGLSLGLIHLSKNGYRQLAFSINELSNLEVSLKTGNAALYTLLTAAKNTSATEQMETFGLGMGHDRWFGKRFAGGLLVKGQYVYRGNWDYQNTLFRVEMPLQLTIMKVVSLVGGPAYSVFMDHSAGNVPIGNAYKKEIAPATHHRFTETTRGWWGWNVGIHLF